MEIKISLINIIYTWRLTGTQKGERFSIHFSFSLGLNTWACLLLVKGELP